MTILPPADEIEPANRAATFEVWDRAFEEKLGELYDPDTFTGLQHRGPSAGTVRVGKNNVGTGKVVMGRHDPARELLTPRRIVRLVEHQLDDYDTGTRTDKDRGAFIVEGSDDIVLRDGFAGGDETVTTTGAGVLDVLNNAVVAPYAQIDPTTGELSIPIGDTRQWSWDSPNATAALLAMFSGTIHVQIPTTTTPWDLRPIAWNNPYDSWIWYLPDAATHPAATAYFRYDHTITDEGDYVWYMSGDDDLDARLNGYQVLLERASPPSEVNKGTYRAGVHLKPGTYTFAVKIRNLTAAGTGGFLSGLWPAIANTGLAGDPLWLTGDPTIGNPYLVPFLVVGNPTQVPGFTPGAIGVQLIDEPKARDARLLEGVTRTFSATHDSFGNPWGFWISAFQRQIGSGVGDAFLALADLYVDVWATRKAGIEINMGPKGSAGSSGVTYSAVAPGQDPMLASLRSLSRSGRF